MYNFSVAHMLGIVEPLHTGERHKAWTETTRHHATDKTFHQNHRKINVTYFIKPHSQNCTLTLHVCINYHDSSPSRAFSILSRARLNAMRTALTLLTRVAALSLSKRNDEYLLALVPPLPPSATMLDPIRACEWCMVLNFTVTSPHVIAQSPYLLKTVSCI